MGRGDGEEIPWAVVANQGEAGDQGAGDKEVAAAEVVGKVIGAGMAAETAGCSGLGDSPVRVPGVAPSEY